MRAAQHAERPSGNATAQSDQSERIGRLRRTGRSLREIAALLGVSKSAVARALKGEVGGGSAEVSRKGLCTGPASADRLRACRTAVPTACTATPAVAPAASVRPTVSAVRSTPKPSRSGTWR
ncbi:MAG: helix-turn-helix domain-containing protein [Deltaproteobacteria bacterium]|nr:MAG: helix-turn-helix domain-containing protein [Deltaproteobacteria bacterium]